MGALISVDNYAMSIVYFRSEAGETIFWKETVFMR